VRFDGIGKRRIARRVGVEGASGTQTLQARRRSACEDLRQLHRIIARVEDEHGAGAAGRQSVQELANLVASDSIRMLLRL
jgi:hypothetical protein